MSVDTIEAPASETQTVAPAAPKAKPKAVKRPTKAKAKRPVVKAKPSANGHVKVLSGLAAAHPKWEGQTCNFRRDGSLTARQIDVLSVLAKRVRPTSALDVAEALKKSDATIVSTRKTVGWAIGALNTDKQDPFTLLNRKMVRHVPTEADGRTEHLFEITASGRKALAASKG